MCAEGSIVAANEEWSTQRTEMDLALHDDIRMMYKSASSIELPSKCIVETANVRT
jgi:hypothetical protein